jgi:hypothetical protein
MDVDVVDFEEQQHVERLYFLSRSRDDQKISGFSGQYHETSQTVVNSLKIATLPAHLPFVFCSVSTLCRLFWIENVRRDTYEGKKRRVPKSRSKLLLQTGRSDLSRES